MDPERGIGLGSFEHAVLDHGLGSAAGLLGGLEAQLDRAPQRVALAREAPREGEQDRGVAVVAACVHLSRRLRAVRDGVLLLDRERVHVGAQQHRPPGARAAHGGEHAGAADACARLEPERLQLLRHQRGGALFLEGQLGMGVQVAARRDHLLDVSSRER